MSKIVDEFKEFAMKGNVIDMAVGVAIGAAFNNIVNSLVNDVIMPIFAAVSSDVKFTDLKLVLKQTGDEVITLNYGQFIQYSVNFLIIAVSIFAVIKLMNKARGSLSKKDSK